MLPIELARFENASLVVATQLFELRESIGELLVELGHDVQSLSANTLQSLYEEEHNSFLL